MIAQISKVCTKCKVEKPVEEFYQRKRTGYLDSWCKACSLEVGRRYYKDNSEKRKEDSRQYRKANPEKVRERERKYQQENSGKIFEQNQKRRRANPERTSLINSRATAKKEGYAACSATEQELRAARTGKCHICKVPEIECKKKLCLDHCHITGRFRGFLCRKCNAAIGLLGDSKEILKAAIDYL